MLLLAESVRGSLQCQLIYNMQLSLILGTAPTRENNEIWKDRVWINSNNDGLYYDSNRIFPNYDNIDSPATLGDLDRELKKRSYLSIEPKFINSNGDLVLNLNKNNVTYNKSIQRYSYRLSEARGNLMGGDEVTLGIILRNYRKMETNYINCDTSLKIIDFLNSEEEEECRVIFPEDKVTSVNLMELSKKFIIPNIECFLKRLIVVFYDSKGIERRETFSSSNNVKLFSYVSYENNDCKKEYNTSLSEEGGLNNFILDLTEDGELTLYCTEGSYEDFYIESLSVVFRLPGKN